MTTNAQAALAAAATLNANRNAVTSERVTSLADAFKTWLDAQDAVKPGAPAGKVMHPRRCLDEATECKYPEPHRHGFACSKTCLCKTGGPLAREYLLDGDERPCSCPAREPAPKPDEPEPDEPEQGEREVQLDALVIPAELTGADELHADKRPDSYGDRGESRKARQRRKGGERGRVEGGVMMTAGSLIPKVSQSIVIDGPSIGFAPNEQSPAMLAHIARQVNATRGRI